MFFEFDESPTLVEFSLLLEVRFEWDIIRRLFVKTSVVILFTFIYVCLIDFLLGFYSRRLILVFYGLLVLASPYFFAE